MKKLIKKYLPDDIIDIMEYVKNKLRSPNRLIIIRNYFNTTFNKSVLISYITSPFKEEGLNLRHTNQAEALEIAKIFNEFNI